MKKISLEASIIAILGADVDDAMKQGRRDLVQRHRVACLKAFTYDMKGPFVDVLREAIQSLSEKGVYTFDD